MAPASSPRKVFDMAAINDAVEALKAEVAIWVTWVEAAKSERDALKARIAELEAAAVASDPLVADVTDVVATLAAMRQ